MKVIVITLRGFSLDYLGCYGNAWVSTPHLDQLAAQAVVFDRHFANVPSPEVTERTWRDGKPHLPESAEPFSEPLSPPEDLLALLKQSGIPTRLITDSLSPDEPWLRGWDECVNVIEGEEWLPPDWPARWQTVLDDQLAKLAGGEQGLLWLDCQALLPPWDTVPEEQLALYFAGENAYGGKLFDEPESDEDELLDEEIEEEEERPLLPVEDYDDEELDPEDDLAIPALQRSFAAMVSTVDARLGHWLAGLEEHGLDECHVIVTTDAGQVLGEHGYTGYFKPWLHEEMVHLPLLIYSPEIAEGRREMRLTQSADLMPTLLDLFEQEIPDSVEGRSFLPLLRDEEAESWEEVRSGLALGEEVHRSIRTEEWAFLMPLISEEMDGKLYVKPEDRWEANDVAQAHFDVVEEMEAKLRGTGDGGD